MKPSSASGTDTSCGTYPNCQNCNSSDGCSGTSYRDYSCSGASCVYAEYPNDSRCYVCTPGQTQSCSTGLPGICSAGTKTCQSNGSWGSCVQNNQPAAEVCSDSLDNDCDGTTDCSDSDCSSNPSCQTPTPTIPTDYISYWKFEGNANDEKGVNNGTIYGNPQFVAGAQGQALSFDGNGDYIQMPTNSESLGMSNTTFSAWIRINNTDSEETYFHNFVTAHQSSGFTVGSTIEGSGRFGVTAGDGADYWLQVALPTNWRHIVVIISANSVDAVYVNGVSQTNLYDSGAGWVSRVDKIAGYGTTIGRSGLITTNYFNGTIDNVMIFNRALSASEIQNIYNSQKLAMGVEPGQDEFFLKNLASILSAIQEVLKKIESLF